MLRTWLEERAHNAQWHFLSKGSISPQFIYFSTGGNNNGPVDQISVSTVRKNPLWPIHPFICRTRAPWLSSLKCLTWQVLLAIVKDTIYIIMNSVGSKSESNAILCRQNDTLKWEMWRRINEKRSRLKRLNERRYFTRGSAGVPLCMHCARQSIVWGKAWIQWIVGVPPASENLITLPTMEKQTDIGITKTMDK